MDPQEFTKVVKAVFKIKGLFQKQLAIKKVRNLTEQRMNEKHNMLESHDREGLAIKEFVL